MRLCGGLLGGLALFRTEIFGDLSHVTLRPQKGVLLPEDRHEYLSDDCERRQAENGWTDDLEGQSEGTHGGQNDAEDEASNKDHRQKDALADLPVTDLPLLLLHQFLHFAGLIFLARRKHRDGRHLTLTLGWGNSITGGRCIAAHFVPGTGLRPRLQIPR